MTELLGWNQAASSHVSVTDRQPRGGLTDSATGSSYFIQWPWRPNNYERSAGSYRAMHAPTIPTWPDEPTGCEPTMPDNCRILRLCVRRIIIVGRFVGLLSEREKHESNGARPGTTGVSAILLNVYVSTVSNLIDNLLGFHVGNFCGGRRFRGQSVDTIDPRNFLLPSCCSKYC